MHSNGTNCRNMEDIRRAYRGGWREAKHHGLIDEAAHAHAWATAVLAYWGFDEPARPDIVSGFRSPDRQRAMLTRWNNGDRWGLAAKPACSSWHMVGRAWDVERHVEAFPWYRFLLESYFPDVRWGGRFSSPDPVHFDLPSAEGRPNICHSSKV